MSEVGEPLHFDLESTTIMAHSDGAVVGKLSTDQEVTEWNISDDRFMVEDGVLKLKPGVEIDDETTSLDITITGVDADGYLSAQSFDMTILDPSAENDTQNIFGDDGDDGEVDEMEEGDLDDEEDESEDRNDDDGDQGAQGAGDGDVLETDLPSDGEGDDQTDVSDDGASSGDETQAGDGVETVEAQNTPDETSDDNDEPSFSDDDPLVGMNMNDNEMGDLSSDTFVLDGSTNTEDSNVEAVEGGGLMFDIMDDEEPEGESDQSEMDDFGDEEDMGEDMDVEFESLDG